LDNTISGLEDSLITGASEKGTRVRLFHPPVEGKLIRGFEGLVVGDRVRVELIGIDVERGFIDLARAEKAAPLILRFFLLNCKALEPTPPHCVAKPRTRSGFFL